MAPKEKEEIGVTSDMIRLSVGIEDLEDIKRDLQQSFDASTGVQATKWR